MIYITGDCHGNFERFNTDIFPEQLEMNKEDYVIICGDFGGIWDKSGDSKKEAMILNQLQHYLLMVIMKILTDCPIIR